MNARKCDCTHATSAARKCAVNSSRARATVRPSRVESDEADNEDDKEEDDEEDKDEPNDANKLVLTWETPSCKSLLLS